MKKVMHSPVAVFPPFFGRSFLSLARVAVVLGGLVFSAMAEDPPKSLLPAFGTAGREFEPKAQSGHDIRGWLPKDWVDNSSWAPVSVIYSSLPDAPAPGVGAIRIEVTKRHSHHSQLTTKGGTQAFKKGVTYVVSGWVRSPTDTPVFIGFRQDEDPKEFFEGGNLLVSPEWKPFSMEWTPTENSNARLMINVHEVGKVDLAGVALQEKK